MDSTGSHPRKNAPVASSGWGNAPSAVHCNENGSSVVGQSAKRPANTLRASSNVPTKRHALRSMYNWWNIIEALRLGSVALPKRARSAIDPERNGSGPIACTRPGQPAKAFASMIMKP
eukprot:CAMPEP_0198527086 /NCGR_PEP_ID=MMETSP1462-20131121/24346_1 /TAXON_ID=1333877 /ORGANISM="Brandtodinium nutriculum, Strain RCC3387" /LENGTH=117 /DNA_ID=CAMNT_0044256879 /DNA_START=94 /DNA_END=444 /DNA_ORIENTATION=-